MIEKIKFVKLDADAKIPNRKNPTDAGIDLYSNESIFVPSHDFRVIHTGISIEIPEGYVFLLKPKGKNIYLIGSGVVDAFYQPGEILVKVINPYNNRTIAINKGDAIAQGLFIKIETPILEEVDLSELENSSSRSNSGGILTQI